MTFQFIVEYIDPKEATFPFDFDYSDEAYDLLSNIVHSKRVRAKNGEQAIQRFVAKYPEYEVIGWR